MNSHIRQNGGYPDHMYDEDSGRSIAAIKVEDLKQQNKSCGNCSRYQIVAKYGTAKCLNSDRRVNHYNICMYHESKKDTQVTPIKGY